jgi:hypothetical protein
MTEDEDYDALSQKHLASIKRDTRVSLEDAAVRATHKVMAEFERETLAPSHIALFFAALYVGEGWYDKYASSGCLHARTRAVVLFDRVINRGLA